jgi:hypothetical protein
MEEELLAVTSVIDSGEEGQIKPPGRTEKECVDSSLKGNDEQGLIFPPPCNT